MVNQFIVILMNSTGIKQFLVNCSNAFSATEIAKAVNPKYRVIEVKVNA